eukprot:TRINITY_DN2084_c0_g1_i1.p1 TRINITY_DN2084_c0_g1~~TRINITY_DN2084_c0_g1_i1.p1  ORF type:complete len:753 (+),score=259.96 TRINITY_DN2084_c0_g1_i1:165-2261(+)
MKLIQKNQVNLYFTLEGREYITPRQLETEIKNEVIVHGGRIGVLELQPILNVSAEQIELKAQEIVNKYRTMHLVQGELISSTYIDRIAEEINESLREYGHVTIVEMSKRFGLSHDFINNAIKDKVGNKINAILADDILYTEAFVDRYRSRIRGLFSALTKPTPVTQILSQHYFIRQLFDSLLAELIKDGRLNGELQGKTYVPAVFEKNRRLFVDNFFKQNGYISYDTLTRLEFSGPKKYLQSLYSDGLALDSCFVGRHIVESVDASILDTVQSNGWLDVMPLLPPPLSTSDAAVILNECSELKKKDVQATILGESFIVSQGLLTRVLKLFEDHITEQAHVANVKKEVEQQQQANNTNVEPAEKEEQPEEPQEGNKKGSRRKQKDTPPAAAKKGAKGKTDNKKNNNNAPVKNENLELLKKWIPDAEEGLLELILEHVKSQLAEFKSKAEKQVFVNTTSDKKEKIKDLFDKFDAYYFNIQLFKKSNEELNDANKVELDKYLLRTLCTDLVNILLDIQVREKMLPVGPVKTPADRVQVMQQLPADLSKAIEKLLGTLTNSTDEFAKELKIVTTKMQMQLKMLEKKAIRNLVFAIRQDTMKQLTDDNNPATAFHLLLSLLYIRVFQTALYLPSRLAPEILLAKLRSSVSEYINNKLAEFNQLLNLHIGQPDNADFTNQLAALLPELKEIALAKETKLESYSK